MQVGQRIVYKGDMANASGVGVVVAVHEERSNSFAISFADARLIPFEPVSYDVVLEDGRRFAQVNGLNIGGEFGNKSKRFMWAEGAADAEEVAEYLAHEACTKVRLRVEREEKAAAFEKAKEAAKAAGVALGLIPEDEFKASGKRGSAAAWNLRQELKAAGIKASVKQDGYTSIDVSLADDKDKPAAKAICDKYEAGRFDGMTDCYEYSPNAWGSVFGDVQYVFGRTVEGYSF